MSLLDKVRLSKFRTLMCFLKDFRFSHGASTRPAIRFTFDKIMKEKRREAKQSVLVQVESRYEVEGVCESLERFGNIRRAFYYSTNASNPLTFALIELDREESVQKALSACRHDSSDTFPTRTRMLRCHKLSDGKQKSSRSFSIDVFDPPSEQQVFDALLQSEDLSSQLYTLYELERVSDMEQRLRFLVCQQVEESLWSFCPNARVLPFGSLVSGLGKHGCDVDMVYAVPNDVVGNSEQQQRGLSLTFQGKRQPMNDRTLTQRILESFGDLLHYMIPGICQVQRILRARVPIVKFQHEFTDCECDLTLNNLSGVHMSRVLHSYGELDDRVRPLVFAIRRWAKHNYLTDKTPGPWVTNFQLTMMVIFLMQHKQLVPPLKHLVEKVGEAPWDDVEFDMRPWINDNDSMDVGQLLREFFKFFAEFDFKNKGVSLYHGDIVDKPEYGAMYIQNPLDRNLNAARTVGGPDLKLLIEGCRDALWNLDKPRDGSEPWGLAAITATKPKPSKRFTSAQRKFQVQELFQAEATRDKVHVHKLS